ncbi:MAG: NAD-dependent epimerase/dehydratase family protein [Formosimonas sp.]
MQRRAWVTGATGGLGRALVQRLCRDGWCVRATGRNAAVGADLRGMGATFEAMDLTRLTVADWMARLHADDVVFHCAALSSPWGASADFQVINVRATHVLAQAAWQVGVRRLIHVSTPSLYACTRHQLNVPETAPLPPPMNEYARSKGEAEQVLHGWAAQGLPVVMLRPRAIFGEHDTVLMPRILRAYRAGRMPLIAGGRAIIDITYVENVVHALCLAATVHLNTQNSAIYNISNGEPLAVREILRQLFAALAWPIRFKNIPWSLIYPVSHGLQFMGRLIGREPVLTPYSACVLAFSQTLDISRARTQLGYAPTVSIAQGLARYVAWARVHEPLIRDAYVDR